MPIDPPRFVSREESKDGGDLFGSRKTVHGMETGEEFEPLLAGRPPDHVGVDEARSNRVDGDAPGTEVLREDTSELLDGTLGSGVDSVVGGDAGGLRRVGREEDDAAACGRLVQASGKTMERT